MREIDARPYTDFKHIPLHQRHDPLPNFSDGLRIPKRTHQVRVDSSV